MTRAEVVAAIREKARVLIEGKRVAHRSCGISLAVAFDRDHRAYQALRRGGVTGEGHCGAILAGQLLLGELLGDPDPTRPATQALADAMVRYRKEITLRLPTKGGTSHVCNDLVARFPDFKSDERQAFCTGLVAEVAEIVAGIALDHGAELTPTAIPER